MNAAVYLTAAIVFFGFLFLAFWWALSRELTFAPELRHFKFGFVLLLLSMVVVAVFGIIVPLGNMAERNSELVGTYRAAVLAVVGVFGYMLTELGHHNVFQRPKYTTWQEHLFFWLTLGIMLLLGGFWAGGF
jgi:hypothetical protein